MSRAEVFDKLQEIFADVFDDDTIELTDETNSNDIEDWDSLEQINLVVAIEKEFSIKFAMGEVSKIKNVGEMVDLILERI